MGSRYLNGCGLDQITVEPKISVKSKGRDENNPSWLTPFHSDEGQNTARTERRGKRRLRVTVLGRPVW